MGKQELKKQEKRIGAIINSGGGNIEFELETLSKYQEENNIERIHKYCITNNESEDMSFEDFRVMISEDLDTVLLVGFYDNFEDDDELIDKIEINIETKSVVVD